MLLNVLSKVVLDLQSSLCFVKLLFGLGQLTLRIYQHLRDVTQLCFAPLHPLFLLFLCLGVFWYLFFVKCAVLIVKAVQLHLQASDFSPGQDQLYREVFDVVKLLGIWLSFTCP